MIDYAKLFQNSGSNSFTDGLQKIDTDSLIQSGKVLHLIAFNLWEWTQANVVKECCSVKFREYPLHYWNASTSVHKFIKRILEVCDNDEAQVSTELANNPPAIKLSKVKTKLGFMCVNVELVNEGNPFTPEDKTEVPF